MLKFLRFALGAYLVVMLIGSLIWLVVWINGTIKFYSIQTGSMAPVLKPGDLAVSVKTNADSLQPGDIISYQSLNNRQIIVTHRLYKTYPQKGYIVTKGDNLQQPDPPITYSAITGKTINVIPKAGYIVSFLHQPFGLVALIYLPALFISAYELQRIAGQYSRKTYKAAPYL